MNLRVQDVRPVIGLCCSSMFCRTSQCVQHGLSTSHLSVHTFTGFEQILIAYILDYMFHTTRTVDQYAACQAVGFVSKDRLRMAHVSCRDLTTRLFDRRMQSGCSQRCAPQLPRGAFEFDSVDPILLGWHTYCFGMQGQDPWPVEYTQRCPPRRHQRAFFI